jgi:hypothetical protein
MNQHFAPRVYLKNFAIKRGSEYYVDVFDKTTKKIFNTNITNICAERHLYTLDEKTTIQKDIMVVEKMFARGFEPMYQRVYKILTNDTIVEISDLQRVEILLAIIQLYTRNPRILKLSVEHHIKSPYAGARVSRVLPSTNYSCTLTLRSHATRVPQHR